MASNLSPSELNKPGREDRIITLIKKYEAGEEFELVSPINGKKKAILIFDEKILKNLKTKTNLAGIVFQSNLGKPIKLTNLAKTKEFGGQADSKKSTTHIEEKEIVSIREQLGEIKKKIQKPTVPIKIKTKIYEVYDIEKTEGTPKSDFHFLDIEGNPIVWMSHKDGSKASDFQQWGGISKTVPNVHRHKETQTFIEQIKETFPEGLPPKTNVVKDIEDFILKAKSVYGDDFQRGSTRYGKNNVNLVLQGPVKLKQQGQYYIVTANHLTINGQEIKDDYEPIFDANYRQGRGQPVPNSRAGVWPKVVGKRPNTIKLPKK